MWLFYNNKLLQTKSKALASQCGTNPLTLSPVSLAVLKYLGTIVSCL